MYASSTVRDPISTQASLRMWVFATKHGLTIEEVEIMLEKLDGH